MKLLKIFLIKQKLKISKWKLRYFKFINFFKYLFNWIKFIASLVLKPKQLFKYITTSTREFFRSLSLIRLSTINMKAVMIFATIMILVSGAGWAFGRGIEAQSGQQNPAAGDQNMPTVPSNTGTTGTGTTGTTGTPSGTGTTGTGTTGNAGNRAGVVGSEEKTGLDIYSIGLLGSLAQAGSDTLWGSINGNTEEELVSREGGLINYAGSIWSYTYQAPISGVRYVAEVKEKLGMPKAQAATGYEYLKPIIPIWSVFRNIALSFIAVVIAVMALIILLGGKFGQITISLSTLFPSVIIAIVMILFSYPLVGFMIDIGQIMIAFSYSLIQPTNPLIKDPSGFALRPNGASWGCDNNNIKFPPVRTDPLDPSGSLGFFPKPEDPKDATTCTSVNLFAILADLNNTGTIKESVKAIIDSVLGSIGLASKDLNRDNLLEKAVVGIVELIFGLAVLTAMFKTFFALLSSYVSIILKTILAPIQLLSIAIKSDITAITNWFMGIMSDVIVFPAVFIAIIIAAVIIGPGDPVQGQPGLSDSRIWMVENSIGDWTANTWSPLPLGAFTVGGQQGAVNIITNLLAFGILLFLPSIPPMIKQVMKVQDPTGGAASQVTGSLKGIASQLPIIGGFVR